MNKPAVQTIKSNFGEIIDCIDIYKQPSLDHPLLRNHTIQMTPNFKLRTINEEKSSIENFQVWHINAKCPEGTVPIKRIRKSDILRASSLESFGKKFPPNNHQAAQGDHQPAATSNRHEHSLVYQLGDPYYGAAADINLWNPRVEPNEFSIAQIWIICDGVSLSTVEAGVMVNPPLYFDNETRLFIFWTADGYKNTGCYNLLCPGFVQTNNEIALNAMFRPLSSYDSNQYQVIIKIFKDNKDGNWWLTVQGKLLGYWPNAILPALENGSSLVEWGGEVLNTNYMQGSTTTQMGSGHFSSEGFKKAAYFRNIRTFDADGNFQDPIGPQTIIENPKCYDLQFDGTSNFYFGGPGKNADCP